MINVRIYLRDYQLDADLSPKEWGDIMKKFNEAKSEEDWIKVGNHFIPRYSIIFMTALKKI